MSRDDTRRRLEEAGRTPAPTPDPAFVEALGARLRAVAAPSAAGAGPSPTQATPGVTRRRAAWPMGVVAAAVAAVLLVALAVSSPWRASPSPSAPPLELTAAVNVVVQLPDGTVVDDPDGLLLPEGATVTVGDGGSARIGGTDLGPGERIVVQAGRIVVQQSAAATGHGGDSERTGPPESAEPTPTGRATSAPTSAAPSADPGRSGAPGSLPPPTPSAPASSSAVPSGQPTSIPGGASAPASSTVPTPTSTPIPRPRLAASLLDPATISVDWTRTPGARQYVLVVTRSKTGAAPRPQYPGSRVQLVFARPPLAPLHLKVADGVIEVKLMVVALDANGLELARSRIVRIDIPPLVTIGVQSGAPAPTPSPSSSPTPSPTSSPTPS